MKKWKQIECSSSRKERDVLKCENGCKLRKQLLEKPAVKKRKRDATTVNGKYPKVLIQLHYSVHSPSEWYFFKCLAELITQGIREMDELIVRCLEWSKRITWKAEATRKRKRWRRERKRRRRHNKERETYLHSDLWCISLSSRECLFLFLSQGNLSIWQLTTVLCSEWLCDV